MELIFFFCFVFFSSCLSLNLEANIVNFPHQCVCFLFYSSCWSRPTVPWHKCVWLREREKSCGWKRKQSNSGGNMTPAVAEVQGSAHTSQGWRAAPRLSAQMCLYSQTTVCGCVFMYVCSLVNRLRVTVCVVLVTLRVNMLLLLLLRHHGHHQLWWICGKQVQKGSWEALLTS